MGWKVLLESICQDSQKVVFQRFRSLKMLLLRGLQGFVPQDTKSNMALLEVMSEACHN